MPFYEYECQSCKYYCEVMQKITDPALKKCPSCGEEALKKLVSAPVFRLKGAGWYETDFKSDKEEKRNLAGAEKEEPKAPAPAAETKETKPAEAKPPAAPVSEPARKRVAVSGGKSPVKSAARTAPPKAKSKAKAKAKAKPSRTHPARKGRR